MQISGNLLPPPSSSLNQSLSENRHSESKRHLDTDQKSRQQTVEYVFEGEVLEQVAAEGQRQKAYAQSIDPANRNAISSYEKTDSNMDHQGRLVDIFI